jgi:MFS family permease
MHLSVATEPQAFGVVARDAVEWRDSGRPIPEGDDKRYILAGSIAVWSSCLALAGLAQSFEQLFIASALVGAGEAGLVPIAIAIVPELFRERQRQLANSLLLVGARLGTGLMIAVCGWVLVAAEPARA